MHKTDGLPTPHRGIYDQ